MSKIFYCVVLTFLSVITLLSSTNVKRDLSCSGQSYSAKATAYFPSNTPPSGGYDDCLDNPLQTLQQFIDGQVDYVSVAMDQTLNILYGTQLCIPELNEKYQIPIEFRVVDSGPAFTGQGFSRIDICVATDQDCYDPSVNGELTLYFPDLQYGSPNCN